METTHTLEPRIRHLVAEHLGLDPDDLAAAASLSDDLAVDSLDRLELAIVLEEEFGIRLPERTIDALRTYGDLIAAVRACLETRSVRHAHPIPVQAHVLATARATAGGLSRAAWLTPYTVETIGEDVLRGGPRTSRSSRRWTPPTRRWRGSPSSSASCASAACP